MGCYGYPQNTSPALDKFTRESMVFTNVISPVPLTAPAHSSLLTGTIPPVHGVHDNLDYRLGESEICLAELFKVKGFVTGAIVSAFVLGSRFGLDQGFDTYNDFDEKLTQQNPVRKGEEVSRYAREWLEQHNNQRFFLFLHYYDPHTSYEPPEPYSSRFRNNLYDGEIAYTDFSINQVIENLKSLNLYDNTLIVLTSDHGEMLGEHGESDHSFFIYQSVLKVPLIFKSPGLQKPRILEKLSGIIDILPTISALLDLQVPQSVQGLDLSSYFFNKKDPRKERTYYCESFISTKYEGNPLLGLITDRHKLIMTSRSELYDIISDPQENHNLINEEPLFASYLHDSLTDMLRQTKKEAELTNKLELDDQALQQLQSLGYVTQNTVNIDYKIEDDKDDPKDLIKFHHSWVEVMSLFREKKYEQAKQICERLLSARPQVLYLYLKLAVIALIQNDTERAISYLQEAKRRHPGEYKVYLHLGIAYQKDRKIPESIQNFEKALQLAKTHQKPDILNSLGKSFILLEKYNQTIKYFRDSLEINPEQSSVLRFLGKAYNQLGQTDEAIKSYKKALQINFDIPEIHRELGDIYYQRGELTHALTHLNNLLQLKPDSAQIMNNIAWLKATHYDEQYRDPKEAIRLAKRSVELDGDKEPFFGGTLAAAYAADGQFNLAVKTAQKAVDLALAMGKDQQAEMIRKNLVLFKSGRPYIQPPPQNFQSPPDKL
ncbi:sulfatase-like hydrolase/transferase [candidate division CSSED10-310 bacterium]|uniref:Sulfatase-like hydrolase/transferase n=1 Tax=candidate division CSSED10-310 bacterium TaxID=2855610 RepID=A0ABV6Z509_UNCC1